jgi:hypothetical protein
MSFSIVLIILLAIFVIVVVLAMGKKKSGNNKGAKEYQPFSQQDPNKPKIDLANLGTIVPDNISVLNEETISVIRDFIQAILESELDLDPILDDKYIKQGMTAKTWNIMEDSIVRVTVTIDCITKKGMLNFWFKNDKDLKLDFEFKGKQTALAEKYYHETILREVIEVNRGELGKQKEEPVLIQLKVPNDYVKKDDIYYYDYFLFKDFLFKVGKDVGDLEKKSEIVKAFYFKEKATGTIWLKSRKELDEVDKALKDLREEAAESRNIREEVRKEVWLRDGGQCVECGGRENLEFDHIIPFSKGGSNTAGNIRILCKDCNRKKSNRI